MERILTKVLPASTCQPRRASHTHGGGPPSPLETAPDDVGATVTEQLSCDLELDIPAVERRFGLVFREYFAGVWPLLEQLHVQGLIELSSRFIGILPAGRLSVDAICNLFDPETAGAGLHYFEKLNPS